MLYVGGCDVCCMIAVCGWVLLKYLTAAKDWATIFFNKTNLFIYQRKLPDHLGTLQPMDIQLVTLPSKCYLLILGDVVDAMVLAITPPRALIDRLLLSADWLGVLYQGTLRSQ